MERGGCGGGVAPEDKDGPKHRGSLHGWVFERVIDGLGDKRLLD